MYIWGRNTVMWHRSADTLFWQLSIDHNMDARYQVNTDGIRLGHLANLANNTRSLQESLARSVANQRARTIVAM